VLTGFWWGNLRKKELVGRPRRRGEDNIKINIQEVGWAEWTGLTWLRTRAGGGFL
jgi:hypothetical protein